MGRVAGGGWAWSFSSHSPERSARGKGSLGDQLVFGSRTRPSCGRKATSVSPRLTRHPDHFRHSDCLSVVVRAATVASASQLLPVL